MEPIINKKEINLAVLGMVDGNGHPYSWSAIVNGYNKEFMKDCPFPVIPKYLDQQPEESFGIPGVKVTHIWCDDPEDAKKVAAASKIENIVSRPEDVIGEVDAVIIPTDKGWEHVDRCRPFVEAGLPIFVDKPMTDNLQDLNIFLDWMKNGAHILSSSSMRYSKNLVPYHKGHNYEIGELRYVFASMPKTWERYGIHSMEGIFPMTGPGYQTVQNTGSAGRDIVHLTHKDGFDAIVTAIYDCSSGIYLAGTDGVIHPGPGATFEAFKTQLVKYVNYLRTGERPFPLSETVELMKIIAAGIMSREQDGKKIYLDDLEVNDEWISR